MGRYAVVAFAGLLLASAFPPTTAHGFGGLPPVVVRAPCGRYGTFHGGVAYPHHGGFLPPFGHLSYQHHSLSRLRSHITGWTGWRTDYVWRNSGPHIHGYRWR